MKRRLGADELGLARSSWEETFDGKRSEMTRKERRAIAEIRQAQRDDAQLCGAIHAETREEGLQKLRAREEEDAKHRPGRVQQTRKQRTSFAEKAEFKARDVDYEEQKRKVAAMSRQKAQRMLDVLKTKYSGTTWPKDVCRLYRLLQNKALVVEAA